MSCKKTLSTILLTPVSVAETRGTDGFTYQRVIKSLINHTAVHQLKVLILKEKKDECLFAKRPFDDDSHKKNNPLPLPCN